MSLPRLLAQLDAQVTGPIGLRTHRRTMPAPPAAGSRPDMQIIGLVRDAGLTGRGGGGFPTGRKMETVAGGSGRPIVVVNGAEGEPASAKDRLLLSRLPHLVLDGALAAAVGVGSDEVVIGLDRKAARSHDALLTALDERHRAGERHVPVTFVDLPSRFVAGEESALVHAINGGDAKPTGTRQRVFVRGVDRRPTMVSNVETYAHLAQIAHHGAAWFRQNGTPEEPGTMLVTMSGDVVRPGVCEVACGTDLGDVLAIAGGTTDRLEGLLVGGYYGAWLSATDVERVALSRAGLRPVGASPGCGALVALPAASCALVETARMLRWMAGETAGQCGPCVHGLPALAAAMTDLATGVRRPHAVADLHRWSTMIDGRGGCTFPDGAVRLVRSTLRVFAADVEHHASHGTCHRVVSRSLLRIPAPEVAWR